MAPTYIFSVSALGFCRLYRRLQAYATYLIYSFMLHQICQLQYYILGLNQIVFRIHI
jgi:hypothetical protein